MISSLKNIIFACCIESREARRILLDIDLRLDDYDDNDDCDDIRTNLSNLVYLLDSPLFGQLLNIEDSLEQLSRISHQQEVQVNDFDIVPASGQLLLTSTGTKPLKTSINVENGFAVHGGNEDLLNSLDDVANGRDVEVVTLFKPENTSLGFGVVSLSSDHQGELGIFVQELQPDGIAAKWVPFI